MTTLRPSFRELKTPADVAAYSVGLDERWPARLLVRRHLIDQIAALPFSPVYVLEFCPGAAALAQQLLDALPTLYYTGIDASPPMLAFARARLAPYIDRATILDADLNQDTWLRQLEQHGINGKFHAVVSLQSLHDLGGEAEVKRVYERAKGLLLPAGLFLNADLVVAPGEELPDNPGRRSIPRHLELLREQGYTHVACTLAEGGFGCVSGHARSEDQ